MNFTKSLRNVFLLIAVMGLAMSLTSQGQQVPEGALAFNGTSSYATMSQSFLNGATVANFSIEFWVKNKRPEIDQHLGAKTEYWKEWGIGFLSGGRVHFMHAWPNTYYTMTTTNGVIKANQWQHIAIVGQGTLGSIYVDGALVHQENSLRGQISFNAASSGSAIAGFVLGFRDNTTLPDDLWFLGELANFRVWDIALSGPQVASLYATSPAINAAGLRHWIPFDEGTGSTFTDIVGGLQGQLFNTTWISAADFNRGLVAYFPFNGNASDASGNGHNGTVTGATLTTDRFGKPNQAYLFGGTAAYITAPFSATVFSNDFTVSVWFNAYDNPNGWHTLLDEPSIGGGGASFNLVIPGTTCGCAGPGHLISTASYPGPSFNWFLDRSQQTPLGTYCQVVITKAGTNVTMYLNSEVAVTGQVSNPTATQPGNTLWIGRAATEDVLGAYVFHGVLDDIRIYNRALSAQEVADLYFYEAPEQPWLGIEVKTVQVTMHVKPTKKYQLEASLDLKTWSAVGNPFVATSSEVVQEFNAIEVGRYFRLMEVQ